MSNGKYPFGEGKSMPHQKKKNGGQWVYTPEQMQEGHVETFKEKEKKKEEEEKIKLLVEQDIHPYKEK